MANGDRSLVPVPSYLRDLYQLITLLLSDRRVAGIADFKALSEVNHEAEVNRLLIWIATATRQFLDMDERSIGKSMANAACGQYWSTYTGDPDKDNRQALRFRQACNIVIHAVEITSYDPDLGYHRGVITIRGRRRRQFGYQANRAALDFVQFAKHCIRLTRELE